jgi:hypothetical protein
MAHFIVKRREFIAVVNRAFGYGRTASYDRWRTIASCDSLTAAQERRDAELKKGGLFQVAIYHAGKRIEGG